MSIHFCQSTFLNYKNHMKDFFPNTWLTVLNIQLIYTETFFNKDFRRIRKTVNQLV